MTSHTVTTCVSAHAQRQVTSSIHVARKLERQIMAALTRTLDEYDLFVEEHAGGSEKPRDEDAVDVLDAEEEHKQLKMLNKEVVAVASK